TRSRRASPTLGPPSWSAALPATARRASPDRRGAHHDTLLWVAYLRLADNSRGPLLSRQRGLSPPVVRSRNGLSAPYSALPSCLPTPHSCCLTSHSPAVGRSFAWCIRYRTWGCGQGGTR